MTRRPARAALNEPPALAPAPALPEAPLSAAPVAQTKRTAAYVPPSRRHRTQIAFFVDPITKRSLETICFNERRTLTSIMLEATDMLFQSRSMTRTAQQRAGDEAPEDGGAV